MNQSIRNAWVAALVLFALVLGSVTVVQFFQQSNLEANAWNTRRIVRDFGMERGSILVDGKPVAESIPAKGQFPYQRVYYDSPMYAPITGFYSLSTGTSQLEAAENGALDGSESNVGDRISQIFTGQAKQGLSVETTLASAAQKAAFDSIPDGVKMSVVALNPKTGQVLAMASKPTFDSNKVSGTDTQAIAEATQAYDDAGISIYRNPATQDTVAPGSVFKIIDTVAALESGKYNKDSVLPNPAQQTFPGTTYTLPNYQGGNCYARTEASFAYALAQSCNTPFISIANTIGVEPIEKTADKFGFNQTMQIPTPVAASVFPSDQGSKTTLDAPGLAQSAIGQRDVKTTPLQVAMMSSAIANDGILMKPNLVNDTRGADLQVVKAPKPEQLSVATTPEIAHQVRDWMRGVVENGLASGLQMPGIAVAAKTGTADIGDKVSADNTNAWLTGFAPADNPQVAFAIVVENTDITTGRSLTQTAARNLIEAVVKQ